MKGNIGKGAMNEEIFFIGLIAFAAIMVFEVTILLARAQLAVRTCRVTNRKSHHLRIDSRPLSVLADIQVKSLKNL
jgi:hypothetical protein